MADVDFTPALRDPQVLEGARTCLEDTASRGSTTEEREAALAWLQEAARSEHEVAVQPGAATPPGSWLQFIMKDGLVFKRDGFMTPAAFFHAGPVNGWRIR